MFNKDKTSENLYKLLKKIDLVLYFSRKVSREH